MVVHHTIDHIRAQKAYDTAIQALSQIDVSKGEAVTALAVIIGTQYFGGPMPERLTRQFITDFTDWLTMYFGADMGAKN